MSRAEPDAPQPTEADKLAAKAREVQELRDRVRNLRRQIQGLTATLSTNEQGLEHAEAELEEAMRAFRNASNC